METKKDKVIPYNFQVTVILHKDWKGKGKPAIELRRMVINPTEIKSILEQAISSKPIIIYPTFSDKIRAIGTLMSNNILTYNYDKKEYKFLI